MQYCVTAGYWIVYLGQISLILDYIQHKANSKLFRAFAIDHQVFALTKLDVTGNGSDDIVVCCWDGQTYILDQNKNSVRFHLDEAVQAFDCGYFYLSANKPNVTCLVYVTFKNTVSICKFFCWITHSLLLTQCTRCPESASIIRYISCKNVCLWPISSRKIITCYVLIESTYLLHSAEQHKYMMGNTILYEIK